VTGPADINELPTGAGDGTGNSLQAGVRQLPTTRAFAATRRHRPAPVRITTTSPSPPLTCPRPACPTPRPLHRSPPAWSSTHWHGPSSSPSTRQRTR